MNPRVPIPTNKSEHLFVLNDQSFLDLFQQEKNPVAGKEMKLPVT